MVIKFIRNNKGSAAATIIAFLMVLVVLLSFVVYSVELFIPIEKYFDMKEICRYTLFDMSLEGELSLSQRNDLIKSLSDEGLTNVNIVYPVPGAAKVKLNGDLRLRIEADYTYTTVDGFWGRKSDTQRMIYDKTIAQKKLSN